MWQQAAANLHTTGVGPQGSPPKCSIPAASCLDASSGTPALMLLLK